MMRKRVHDPEGFPKAMPVSAATGDGLAQAWEEMQALAAWRRDHGHWAIRRAEQARHWFEAEVRAGLLAQMTASPELRAKMAELGTDVAAGRASPDAAAAAILAMLDC